MNTTGKVIVGIIVVIVIAAGGYYWYSSMHTNANVTQTNSTTGTASETVSGAAVSPLPAGSNTSDTALTQDTAAIDAQMNTLNTDNTQASQSVGASQ